MNKINIGTLFRPAANIPSEKSNAVTAAPFFASGSLEEPVPAAKSRILIPTLGAISFVTLLRQRFVCPKLKMSLAMS